MSLQVPYHGAEAVGLGPLEENSEGGFSAAGLGAQPLCRRTRPPNDGPSVTTGAAYPRGWRCPGLAAGGRGAGAGLGRLDLAAGCSKRVRRSRRCCRGVGARSAPATTDAPRLSLLILHVTDGRHFDSYTRQTHNTHTP